MTSTCIYGVKSNTPSIDGKFHYVYRITNLVENKHYYGKRSSKINPHLDIGIKYFSSSKDKAFIKDQQENPEHYKYKVVASFSTSNTAIELEMKLHKKFSVAKNGSFYNRKEQCKTEFGAGVTGFVSVVDDDGKSFMISNTDPDYLAGKYVTSQYKHRILGFATMLDKVTKKHIKISTEEVEKNPERYEHIGKNQVTVRDKAGMVFNVMKTDPRYISGEVVSILKGQVTVYDEITEKTFNISKEDPRYISGELRHINQIFVTVKDSNGNKMRVKRDDPRYISGELLCVVSGTKWKNTDKLKGYGIYSDKNGNNVRTKKDDPRVQSGELKGVLYGLLRVKNRMGEQIWVKTDDPRYTSGEYIHWNSVFKD